MGRKPLSGQPKADVLKIRLTVEERAAIDAAAGERGTSTWAREVLLREAARAARKS